MKRFFFSSLFLSITLLLYPQQITLEECRRKAQANYPLAVQYELVEKAREYNLNNAARGYLPQFSLSAKASYQSDVTKLPVEIPGVTVKGVPKDQYQVMLEMAQTIWDGGSIRSQRALNRSESQVEQERLNVDMYAVNKQVNELYFGILLLDEQLKQNMLLQTDLKRTYQQIEAYMKNGIANQPDLDAVRVEQLNAVQKEKELVALRSAYIDMLSLLTGEVITQEAILVKPTEHPNSATGINRPELSWFEAQETHLQVSEGALRAKNLPRLGLFIQGAYGNPGLNMLKDEFSPYYIAGIRLSWNFGALYTLRNDKRLIENNRRKVQSNREQFLFNTRLQARQERSAVESSRSVMYEDDEIIKLRENIRKAAEVKVANGTLTVTEMLREITAVNMARQTKAQHEIQYLMNIYQLKNTRGE